MSHRTFISPPFPFASQYIKSLCSYASARLLSTLLAWSCQVRDCAQLTRLNSPPSTVRSLRFSYPPLLTNFPTPSPLNQSPSQHTTNFCRLKNPPSQSNHDNLTWIYVPQYYHHVILALTQAAYGEIYERQQDWSSYSTPPRGIPSSSYIQSIPGRRSATLWTPKKPTREQAYAPSLAH